MVKTAATAVDALAQTDPEIRRLIEREERRQRQKLELIASENFASRAVLEAAGTILTNKYAEGYPGARYYGGCEVVDEIEELARTRAKALYSAEYANVQPHSGSSANMAVYLALLQPGDPILAMDLAHGGHLTHGAKVSISGKLYRIHAYGVAHGHETIDYDDLRRLALSVRPKLIISGYSAYPRRIDFAHFRAIADEAGALLMVDMAHIAGLVAAAEHPSPLPHAHVVTTTTHKTLRGPRGGMILIGADGENRMGITAPKSGRVRRYSELFDSAVMPGVQGGPLMHIIAAKAVALKDAAGGRFRDYQRRIVLNARALAEALQAGGARLVTGGTDTHLMLIDLTTFDITGRAAEEMLDRANITVNKNAIPFDSRSPLITSGIRVGVPAVTTRGMGVDDMRTIAGSILEVLRSKGDEAVIEAVRKRVAAFTADFPLVDE